MAASIEQVVGERAVKGNPGLDPLRSDAGLLKRYANGDVTAFSALYTRYYRLVYAVALGVLSSVDDAEDATQEVFITASRNLSEYKPDNLKAWLASLARNAAIDILRKRKITVEFDQAHGEIADSPYQVSEKRNELRNVLKQVSRLSEQHRTALLMREASGMSYVEIAEALGSDESSIRDTIKRARLNLRSQKAAENADCTTIREFIASVDDRRKYTRETKYHLKHCHQCQTFADELNRDRRVLRGAVPPISLGLLWKFAVGAKASAAPLQGGLAKTGGGLSIAKSAAVVSSVAVIGGAGYVAVKTVEKDSGQTAVVSTSTVQETATPPTTTQETEAKTTEKEKTETAETTTQAVTTAPPVVTSTPVAAPTPTTEAAKTESTPTATQTQPRTLPDGEARIPEAARTGIGTTTSSVTAPPPPPTALPAGTTTPGSPPPAGG